MREKEDVSSRKYTKVEQLRTPNKQREIGTAILERSLNVSASPTNRQWNNGSKTIFRIIIDYRPPGGSWKRKNKEDEPKISGRKTRQKTNKARRRVEQRVRWEKLQRRESSNWYYSHCDFVAENETMSEKMIVLEGRVRYGSMKDVNKS